jgi:hypothetical protein
MTGSAMNSKSAGEFAGDRLHLKPALPNDERPHEHCRSDKHHTNDDVPRRMFSMPFAGEFAVVLFPLPLLVLPLFLMVFVLLLLAIHDFFSLRGPWFRIATP